MLIEERAGISFAMNGAKDNPWIESFWGRFKTENHSLMMQANSLTELICVTEAQMTYYKSGPTAFCLELPDATRRGAGHSYEKYHA